MKVGIVNAAMELDFCTGWNLFGFVPFDEFIGVCTIRRIFIVP